MIPHTALYTEAIAYSHSIATRVDLVVGDVVVENDIPVVSGKVTSDRGSNNRWQSDVVMGLQPWSTIKADAYKTRFRVYHGVSSIGYTELMMLGEYRVDQITRNNQGELQIKGVGLESYVTNARFLRPRPPMTGSDTVAAIQQLIVESVPHAKFRNQAVTNRKIALTAPWDRDRIDAVNALGTSINSEVYCANDGVFVVAAVPNMNSGIPVFTIRVGEGGLLSAQDVTSGRTSVYNGVSVAGAEGIYGFASDNDPNSPTYWLGEYGQVPRFYSSQYMTTVAQCNAVAVSMLAEAMASNRTLKIEAGSPLTFLEAGDLVTVGLSDGTFENHLIQKTDLDLSTTGGTSMETLATKTEAPDSPDPAP